MPSARTSLTKNIRLEPVCVGFPVTATRSLALMFSAVQPTSDRFRLPANSTVHFVTFPDSSAASISIIACGLQSEPCDHSIDRDLSATIVDRSERVVGGECSSQHQQCHKHRKFAQKVSLADPFRKLGWAFTVLVWGNATVRRPTPDLLEYDRLSQG